MSIQQETLLDQYRDNEERLNEEIERLRQVRDDLNRLIWDKEQDDFRLLKAAQAMNAESVWPERCP